MQGGKLGNAEIHHSNLVGRAVFALRGCGEFEVRWGAGAYGKDLNECLGRLSSYGKEVVLAPGSRCLITNRMAYGLSTLEIGTYSRGQEDSNTVALVDFAPSATEEMENHFFPNANAEPAG